MNAQDLRNSILQLAVQGKLVEQRPEEGTAKELLGQIRAEKQRLIKEKKIKKEQLLPEIAEDEIPFEIPKSWEWVRLIDICKLISDGTHKTPAYTDIGIPFVSVKDISSGHLDLSNVKYISEEEHQQLTERCMPQKDDVLVCRIGTLGKAIRIDIDIEFSIFVSLGLLKFINNKMADYIVTVINSGYGYKWIEKNKVGGGTHTNKINLETLKAMPIPLPPLAEQKRIVAKIEEVLPYIEQYDKAHTKLEVWGKKFPEDMKKSILQLAMQGKLVEQRPEEGTADELYKQIEAEKARLVKAGKIKAEKLLSEIGEEEIPFEIPKSWKWVRFGNAISLLSGTDFKPEEYNDQGIGTVYITGASNIDETGVIISRWTEKPRNIACQGDVLLVCKGSGYGKTVICNIKEAHIARQIMSIKKLENLDMKFVKYYLDANFIISNIVV